jgi:pilus assembly protein CpaE
MNSVKLSVYIQDPPLCREALDILKPISYKIPFDHHEGDWNSLLERLVETKPEAILLDVSSVPSDLNTAIRQLRYYVARLKVIAVHTSAEGQTILSAMRAGVNEFLHSPLEDSLESAIDRILISSDSEEIPARRGKVIGFLSSKGGCGATTVACHVATELQALTKKSVLLVDLDLTSGLVSFLMKTPSSYSILDALKNISRLDESLWKALLVEHKTGVSVIPAPAVYSRWDHPDEDDLRQVLKFMRTQHDWIILDLGRSLNSIATAVLDELDQLFLISTLEVVALHGLKSIVHGLFQQGEKLQLVLNRTPKTMDITVGELEKILGRSLYASIPNDYMSLYQAYSSGNLLDPNNRLSQQLSLLASRISGIQPVKSKKKFALFG